MRGYSTPILVKDVAKVKIGALPEIRRGAGSHNGKETVLGKVVKQPGINTINLSDKVTAVLKSLEQSMPEGIKIKVEYAQAELIRRAVDTVKEALRDGAILVVVVLAIFLFNVRTALITPDSDSTFSDHSSHRSTFPRRHAQYHDACRPGDRRWHGS